MGEYRTIGIAGASSRIGTTTQALLLQNYCNRQGFRSVYIEMNNNGYLDNITTLYAGTSVNNGLITCINHVLCPKDTFANLNKDNFQYLIKDYGSVQDKYFQKMSFLEQDIRVIVCGLKSNEIIPAYKVLEEDAYLKSCFIFSFITEEDRAEIAKKMENIRTYFADYTPDPFADIEVPYGKEITSGRQI